MDLEEAGQPEGEGSNLSSLLWKSNVSPHPYPLLGRLGTESRASHKPASGLANPPAP